MKHDNAQKFTWQGEVFGSKAEWERYVELLLDLRLGDIFMLVRQPRFELGLDDRGRMVTWTPHFGYAVRGDRNMLPVVDEVRRHRPPDFSPRVAFFMMRFPQFRVVVNGKIVKESSLETGHKAAETPTWKEKPCQNR